MLIRLTVTANDEVVYVWMELFEYGESLLGNWGVWNMGHELGLAEFMLAEEDRC